MGGLFALPPPPPSWIGLIKQTQIFLFEFTYNADNSNLFVNEKEIFKCKADNKNFNLSNSILSKRFSTTESREVSLNGNVYAF